uniref:BPTI/Kunitz inhibitor domain-containing protein n=2 Tax=Ixodes ricinus TaxID=34613 RepID=V5H4A1_IXORI
MVSWCIAALFLSALVIYADNGATAAAVSGEYKEIKERNDGDTDSSYHLHNEAPRYKKCYDQFSEGYGTEQLERFFYNSTSQKCEKFMYKGAGGTRNNFDKKSICQYDCEREKECKEKPEAGNGAEFLPRYYYDYVHNTCKTFYYGGIGGNGNNFLTRTDCDFYCRQKDLSPTEFFRNHCWEPPNEGDECTSGNFNIQSLWSYNNRSGECEPLEYTGCGGNDNKYDTKLECEQMCGDYDYK